MICDHLIEFRARNPLYFKIISIYFKIISKLFHQIHDFGHRCLQKSIGDQLLMCLRKFWMLENRFWDIRFPIPAESARRTGPRPLRARFTRIEPKSSKNCRIVLKWVHSGYQRFTVLPTTATRSWELFSWLSQQQNVVTFKTCKTTEVRHKTLPLSAQCVGWN